MGKTNYKRQTANKRQNKQKLYRTGPICTVNDKKKRTAQNKYIKPRCWGGWW